MTHKTWVYSDPHFYHQNICVFTNYDGSPLRPWDDAETMTEDLIERYNALVGDQDRVYILGDVAFTPNNMERAVSRLKGRKVLVPGNHDPQKMRRYIGLFDDIRGYVVKKGYIMSHIPLHPDCLYRWKLNIHGHLHGNQIMATPMGFKMVQQGDEHAVEFPLDPIPDPRYFNASVEQTDFQPIELD